MTSEITLRERTIVVSGASRGIGEAIARACAAAGANVVLASRKQDDLDAVAESIRESGATALPVACHMGHPDQIAALFDRVVAEFGAIHGLVNNAATNPFFGPMLTIDDGAFDKTFEVNVKGYLFAIKEFAARAKAGAVVNLASYAGVRAAPMLGVYAMTKAAVISMTQTLAVELGGAGIRVNAVAPGIIDTRFSATLLASDEIRERELGGAPIPRPGQPDEIAGAVVYLLSDAASYVTGQTLLIDGGRTAV